MAPSSSTVRLLVGQRSQAINARRGHATEFGVVATQGKASVEPLSGVLAADSATPAQSPPSRLRVLAAAVAINP
jgi:hypothetical protein